MTAHRPFTQSSRCTCANCGEAWPCSTFAQRHPGKLAKARRYARNVGVRFANSANVEEDVLTSKFH